jgi:hypothetical protein
MTTGNPAKRGGNTQETRYFRKVVNFNDALIGSATLPPSFGVLPEGAFITLVLVEIGTAFNAGTTNVLSVGITPTNPIEIATTGDLVAGTAGIKTPTRGLGTILTGGEGIGSAAPLPTSAPTLYVKYTQTGTAATAGQATIVIEFVSNNDQ